MTAATQPAPMRRRPAIAVDVVTSISSPVDADAVVDSYLAMALAQLGYRMVGSELTTAPRE